MYQSKLLSSLPHIRHGFMTRQGGVSEGDFSSLNVGLSGGDQRQSVLENRRRVAEKVSGSRETPLLSQRQIHSDTVHVVTNPWTNDDRPEGDGLVTTQAGILLAALSSDCMPILMADEKVPVVAAIHAGWGGAWKGVIERTVEKMCELGAHHTTIRAAIGPCIQQFSYEVGPEFYERFITQDEKNASFFIPSSKQGYYLFNLPAFGVKCLKQSGLTQIDDLGLDTYTNEHEFFSYRRKCHRQETHFGSGVSVIMLKELSS